VRQLENALFRAVVMAESDAIGLAEFPQIAAQTPGVTVAEPMPLLVEPLAALAPAAPEPARAPRPQDGLPQVEETKTPGALNPMSLLDEQGEVRPMEEIEADVIRFAIAHCQGRMSEVARRLQIGRSTLYRKLESLQIETSEADSEGGAVAAG
jgi:DNA-binding NtrC family response regulator